MADRVHIGLLRGINVGGANKISMKDLAETATAAGFDAVKTYVQSGNLVFRASGTQKALAKTLVTALAERNGLDVTVMVCGRDGWKDVIAKNPFPHAADNHKTLHTFILDRMPSDEKLDDLRSRDFGTDEWKIVDGTLYLYVPDGLGRSKLANSVERILKVAMTARNWRTVLALDELADEIEAQS
jgi:uncharacterized protein (DUF1697 family)